MRVRGVMLRVADCECKLAEDAAEPELVRGIAPKSPFQIGGAGAVGTGTLRGIPLLERLRAGGFAVWPFDRARLPLLLEIYPRLLTGPVRKSRTEERVRYLRAMKERGVLTPKARRAAEESEDAFDAAVSAVRMGARREEFARLKRLNDPLRQMEGKVWGAGAVSAPLINARRLLPMTGARVAVTVTCCKSSRTTESGADAPRARSRKRTTTGHVRGPGYAFARHDLTYLAAAAWSITGPLTTSTLPASPESLNSASMTTIPSTFAALAMGG